MRIFGNLGYKLLAVVIAVFLWVVARGSSSVERGFDIPVVLQGVPEDLVVVDQGADVVNVRLLGSRSALRNFDPERLEYLLEISEAKPGQADFEVDLSRFDLPRGARVVSRSPSRIELSLERRIARTVKVKPDVEGIPAEGYRIARVSDGPPEGPDHRCAFRGATALRGRDRNDRRGGRNRPGRAGSPHFGGTRPRVGRVAANGQGQGGRRGERRRCPGSPSAGAGRSAPRRASPALEAGRRGGGMARELFGTDGVRGRANVDPMTAEMALALGQAVSVMFRRRGGERHKIIIGKDTRRSGYMFENALVAGICSMGVDVLQVGPMPTPGHGLPHRRHALRRRRDDLGQPQPVHGQRHQVLLARRLQAPRRVRAAHRGADPQWQPCVPARAGGGSRSRTAHRGRDRPLRRVPEEDLPAGADARRPARRARLRERRGLQGRPDGAQRARLRGLRDRRRAERQEHQRRRRLGVPGSHARPR